MTSHDPKDAPSGPQPTLNWVSSAEAAAALGVSTKTLLRRIRRGELRAEKAALPTGGLSWRVHLPNGKDSAKDTEGTQSERKGHATEGAKDRKDSARDTGKDSAPEVLEMALDALAREREQNAFLRGVVEQLQRDGAETRAALRKALEAMPRALPSPSGDTTTGERLATEIPLQNKTKQDFSAGNAGAKSGELSGVVRLKNAPRIRGAATDGPGADKGPQNERKAGKTGLSYGDVLADLERDLGA